MPRRQSPSRLAAAFVVAAAAAPTALAECWTRSDGVRVCSVEVAGWVSVWWFWFAVLLLLALVTGCWDSCGKGADDADDALSDVEAAKAAGPAASVAVTVADPFARDKFTEPLLEPVTKPNYRYL